MEIFRLQMQLKNESHQNTYVYLFWNFNSRMDTLWYFGPLTRVLGWSSDSHSDVFLSHIILASKNAGVFMLSFLLLLKTMSYLDAGFKADGAASTVIKIAQVPLKGVFIITPWYLFINTNQTMLCCKYITHYFNWKLTYNQSYISQVL